MAVPNLPPSSHAHPIRKYSFLFMKKIEKKSRRRLPQILSPLQIWGHNVFPEPPVSPSTLQNPLLPLSICSRLVLGYFFHHLYFQAFFICCFPCILSPQTASMCKLFPANNTNNIQIIETSILSCRNTWHFTLSQVPEIVNYIFISP
jgi:hypothetical protein